jgi:uncharacterized membrane protein
MGNTEGPGQPEKPADVKHPEAGRSLGEIWERLLRLERSVPGELRSLPAEVSRGAVPAWRRVTEGETRWQVSAAIAVAIILQPASGRPALFHPTWLLPTLEALLGVGLIIANPRRINRQSTILRSASLMLIALISLANAWSAGRLIYDIVHVTHITSNATNLLVTGGTIWLTNVIAFALWYWEFDRGGPVARALALKPYPDFLFPQMTSPQLARPSWEPMFGDYFYLAFTNATAFSPTDVMPLSRWAKMLMLVQSAVSVLLAALVIARAVNILR